MLHRLRLLSLAAACVRRGYATSFDGVAAVTRKQLTLEAADAMAQAALTEATQRKFNDVSVAVVDASGRELVAKTQPGCPPLIPYMAKAKAGVCDHARQRAARPRFSRFA